jgi:predicted MFS family arabinose efflux permease
LVAVVLGIGLVMLPRFVDRDTGDVHGVDGRLRIDGPSMALLIAAGLYSAAAELMFVVLGAWLEDSFGLSLIAAGGVAVFIGVAELLGEGTTTVFVDNFGKRRSVMAGIIVTGLGFAAIALVRESLVAGVAATMVAYFGFELAIVSSIPYASEIHPHARARFLAWLVVGLAVGRTVGSALGPRLYTGSGVAAAALVAAALNVIALGVFAGGGTPLTVGERRSVPNSGEPNEGE